MNNKELHLKEIEDIPEDKIQEEIDFVCFLKRKGREDNMDLLLICESSLAKAWNYPKDDEVWSEL